MRARVFQIALIGERMENFARGGIFLLSERNRSYFDYLNLFQKPNTEYHITYLQSKSIDWFLYDGNFAT